MRAALQANFDDLDAKAASKLSLKCSRLDAMLNAMGKT
jgi:hypothetical protein